MLIEFSIQNYRSIRERQTLSMVAAPRLRKKENTFKVKLINDNLPSLHKMAAIYGPNASGKSNVLLAFSAIKDIVNRAPSSLEPLPVAPFRFDPSLHQEPSFFEIHFVCEETRYQFELAVSSERVHLERLTYYPRGKEKLIYSREIVGSSDKYEFDALEGSFDLHRVWSQLTGAKTLFIAQAVANSSEDLRQLRAPFHWLSAATWSVDSGFTGLHRITQHMAADNEVVSKNAAKLLRDIDVPIASITSKVQGEGASNFPLSPDNSALLTGSASGDDIAKRLKRDIRTTFVHETSLGVAEFDFEDESEGTKNLFAFSIPWLLLQTGLSQAGCHILIVDEFDSSLHPKVVEALVERHLKSATCGQLIFTTHDTHLMDSKLLRRDQIWTTERGADGSTTLRSIHDFEGREGEDIEKRYYEGRYRALPHVREV